MNRFYSWGQKAKKARKNKKNKKNTKTIFREVLSSQSQPEPQELPKYCFFVFFEAFLVFRLHEENLFVGKLHEENLFVGKLDKQNLFMGRRHEQVLFVGPKTTKNSEKQKKQKTQKNYISGGPGLPEPARAPGSPEI
jgi:hypothetical protein